MIYVDTNEWRPSPGILLTGKALDIVTNDASESVLAGPGAGKTELLAQRANFLLSTGTCRSPRRILAISFKVDAASNLKNRVEERCDALLTQRFESLTLDAFAKRLVDQFMEALPDDLRPSSDYNILFPDRQVWLEFRNRIRSHYPDVNRFTDSQLNDIVHCGVPDFHYDDQHTPEQQIQCQWWRQRLDPTRCELTFDMIKSLAVCILSEQPIILSALRRTYSHVFLDEFQDVTKRQYELICSCFHSADAILTAVGDSNQAIMRWAGAQPDIFDRFSKDFGASSVRLQLNFRSNARIVKLINNLTDTMDEDYFQTECSRPEDPIAENPVQGWVFETRDAESQYLASFIHNELRKNEDLSPSDFVILARIRVGGVEERIKRAFGERNLKVRNEARNIGDISIQDLVKETAYLFLLASVKLAVNVRGGQPYQDCMNTFAEVKGEDLNNDKGHSETFKAVRLLVEELKKLIDGRVPTEVSGKEIVDLILGHVGSDEFSRTFLEYKSGSRLNSIIMGFEMFFDESRDHALSWTDCISNMEGSESIRLMTIHKSKGLEYHTVIFVEFNDDSFWGNEDDVNVFFVALSRARERVYFSHCLDSKGAKTIRPLIDRLKSAEVSFVSPEVV